MMKRSAILFCRCTQYDSIPNDVKETVYSALKSSEMEFETVDDLCGMAARKDEFFGQIKNRHSLHIVACSRRAVKWLFHFAGEVFSNDIKVSNMMELDAETIIHSIGIDDPSPLRSEDRVEYLASQKEWIPWFPVIDYDRCDNCKQCLNFCLFRVFETNDDGRVVVSNPENCKTGCPACARVCPENAILFPKHNSSQINGSDLEQSKTEKDTNLETLLQGDLQDILRKRNAGAKGNFPSMDDIALAHEERKKCGCQTSAKVQIGLTPNLVNIQSPASSAGSQTVNSCKCSQKTEGESNRSLENNEKAEGDISSCE